MRTKPRIGVFKSTRCLFLCLLVSAAGRSAHAEDGWEGHIFSLFWENDAVARSDRHYTQGAGLSYFMADRSTPDWLQNVAHTLPSPALEVAAVKAGFGIAQEIYTPDNLAAVTLTKDDHPYAGWLYGSFSLQRRGPGYRSWPTIDLLRIDLGVIGPESLAEETQKTWHGTDPGGWNHQLRFEPGLVVRYERQHLFAFRSAEEDWGIDLIPSAGAAVGNVATFIRAGGMARMGYHIPNEFGTADTEGPLRFGAYLFAGVEGRYVVRDIFLDGNTFRDSHSVDKHPLVGSYKVGLALVLRRFEITLAHTFRTRQFERQKTSDSFGMAAVAVKF